MLQELPKSIIERNGYNQLKRPKNPPPGLAPPALTPPELLHEPWGHPIPPQV